MLFQPQDANQAIFIFNNNREITEIQEEIIKTPQTQHNIIDKGNTPSQITEIHNNVRNIQTHLQNLNNTGANQSGSINHNI